MAWAAPQLSDVFSEIASKEISAIQIALGTNYNPDAVLDRVIAKIRDCIRSGGYDLDPDTTKIPLGLHDDAIAITRWKMLATITKVDVMQTDGRKKMHDDALQNLENIKTQKQSVEPPTAGAIDGGGSWDSENKLIMRTHPMPRPQTQFAQTSNDYSNPTAPTDQGTTA